VRVAGSPFPENALVRIAIRPEWMDLFRPGEAPPDENALAATVDEVIYLGETIHVVARLAAGARVAVAVRNEGQLVNPLPWRRGDAVAVGWRPEDCQVPYQWGVTGVAWRRDRLDAPPESWALFQNARWRGKLTMLDDVRDAIGAWLRYRGHSLNSSEPAHLAQARTDALAAKPNLKAYISAPVKAQLVAGDVWAAQLWNGDAAQAALEQPAISFNVPREGATIWTDSLVLTREAPHPRAAHEFMNYLLRPEVGAAISATTGYGTPNRKAFALLEHPVAYPSRAELARLEYQRDLGRDTAIWDQIWTEVKSA